MVDEKTFNAPGEVLLTSEARGLLKKLKSSLSPNKLDAEVAAYMVSQQALVDSLRAANLKLEEDLKQAKFSLASGYGNF